MTISVLIGRMTQCFTTKTNRSLSAHKEGAASIDAAPPFLCLKTLKPLQNKHLRLQNVTIVVQSYLRKYYAKPAAIALQPLYPALAGYIKNGTVPYWSLKELLDLIALVGVTTAAIQPDHLG